jgi:hypothetical protein
MSAKKNNAFNALPRFIWGEAVSEAGFEAVEFLTHTRYPRFICRVYEGEDIDTEPQAFQSQLGQHPNTGELVYVTSLDVGFKDWVFLDTGTTNLDALKSACDEAIANYMMRDDEYGINDDAE